jgi:Excalibur calcium-binding domain
MSRVPLIRLARARDPDYEARRLKRRFARVWRAYERAMNRRRRWKQAGQIALVALAALGGFAVVFALLSFDLLPPFRSSPEVTVWRSVGPFRTCAEARAASVAPITRGQPGYASHLDADDDGIACEWSWRSWFW